MNWNRSRSFSAMKILIILTVTILIVPGFNLEGSSADSSLDTEKRENEKSTRGLLDSSFPMFKGGPQRTGRCDADTSDNPGMIKWTYQYEQSRSYSTPVIGTDGTIYYGIHANKFLAVNPNGTLKWKFDTGGPVMGTAVLDSYGHIYFGSSDGHFYCLYISNGTEKWRNNFGGGKAGPVITEDDIIYHVSGYRLVAMDLNGNIIWRNDTLDMYISSPAVGHDGTVYVGSYDNHLYAVHPNNGTVKWSYGTGGYISTTPAVDKNNSIFFGCWDGYFYALHSNGTLKWRDYRPGTVNNNWHSSPVIKSNNTIYIIDPHGILCEYDINGELTYHIPYGHTYSTPTIDSRDIIYITGGKLVGLSTDWSIKIYYDNIAAIETSPSIGPDGTIYLSDVTGTLTAIGKQQPKQPKLSLRSSGDQYVKINWTIEEQINSPGLESIKILRRTVDHEFSLIDTIDGSATHYNDTTVENGVEYDYRVIAVNKYGESQPSNIVSAIPRTTPEPPINAATRWGNDFIEISWEPPEDDGGANITGYQVWKRKEGEIDFEMIAEPDHTITVYNDTNVVNGYSYEYYLIALNSEGSSPPSEIVSDVPKTIPGSPIIDVTAHDGFVLINWIYPSFNGGSNITGFRIYRGINEEEMELISEPDADMNSFNDSSVSNGITYNYHMTCINIVGESLPSLKKTVKPMGEPTEPLSLTAVSGNSFVHLSWSVPADDQGSEILGYILFVSSGKDGSEVDRFYDVEGMYNTDFNDTYAVNGIEYTYYVIAVNSIGLSERSNEIKATPLSVPSPPAYIDYIAGDGFVNVIWMRPRIHGGSPIDTYYVYRQEGTEDFQQVAQVDQAYTEYNDTNVHNGVLYTYYVVAENGVGRSEGSEFINAMAENNIIPTPPARPNNLSINAGEGFVLLKWDPPLEDGGSVITEYWVYRGGSEGSFEKIATVPSGEKLEFNDTEVEGGRSYLYRVTAVNSIGESLSTSHAKAEIPDGSSSSSGSLLWLFIIIAILLVIAGIASAVYFTKIRKGAVEEEEQNNVENENDPDSL